jgi:hypothetical protein
MTFDDFTGDGKSEPGTRMFGGKERAENILNIP